MNRYREPTYTLYVRHCLRFYTRYPNITQFRNETDRLNWQACHNAMQNYSTLYRDILTYIYSEGDTLADNVYVISKKYGASQDAIRALMREFERVVAEERGLL